MKKVKLKVILILLFINLVLVNLTVSSSDNTNSDQYEQIISLLPEEIIFTYNSSFCSQEFSFETFIQLDSFNGFSLYFATSGDKTTSEGIKVTLSLEKVEVVCIIERLFQDTLSHNLTQAFSYPDVVDGKMNVTITCEAQTSSSYYSGSLRIFSQTKAEKILPPTITESSFSLPVVPNWLEFKGSLSTVMRSVTTAFNNSNNFDKLNLTISFRASEFSAYLRQFEVKINENIESTRSFKENQLTEETFLFSINPGLNFLTINFIVELCLDEIQLTNICLIGNGMNVESILPENTYDWLTWENSDVNYVFDLSSFKPETTASEQILQIGIKYGCFGTTISPAIYYEIKLGTIVIDSGEISESDQINSPQTLFVQTPITNYHDLLTFRIQGRAEGYGIFYVLNTSYVTIDPLPELNDQDLLERKLVETEVHHTQLSGPLVLTYSDFFKTDFDYLKCNISLSFSLTDEYDSSIRQIDVLMKLNWQTVIDHQLTYEDQINVTESEILYNNMYDVTIILTVYGDGRIITLSNLKYVLLPLNSYNITLPEPPPPPEESYGGRDPIHPTKLSLLYIEYGIITLGLTLLILQILSKRKNKQESAAGETQVDDLEIQIVSNNIQYGHFSKLLQLPKNWYLKAKESLSRMMLLILTVVHVVTNVICFSVIIDKLNEIAQREMQEVKLVVLGEVGFYCYMVCVYASTLVAFSAFYLASSDTFYDDFFRFTKYPGIFIFILFFSSWITLFIYIQQNISNHGIAGTLFVPFIFLGIVIFLVWLGKTKEKQFERLVKNFFKSGRIKVSNIRRDNTETDSMIEEESLSSAQYNAHFQKIVNLIIQDISIKLQVPVNRFTELLGISPRLAHRLLIDVSNKIPKLGKYYVTEQIYIRSSDSEIGIDTLENMTEEKKGELISKYDKNSVNSEKTANNHDDMENQKNEETPDINPEIPTIDHFYYYKKRLSTLNWADKSTDIRYLERLLKANPTHLDFKKFANEFFKNKGNIRIESIDAFLDFLLYFTSSPTRGLSYNKHKTIIEKSVLKEEWASVIDLIKKHELDNKFAFQIARFYLKIYELKMKDTNIFKGECSFAEILYSIFKYLWFANLYLEDATDIDDGWKRWQNIRYTFRTIFGVNELPFMGNIKAIPLVDKSSAQNNKIYQDGIFVFNPSSSPNSVPFLSVDVTQLSLNYSAFNTRLEDEKSYKDFFNTRSGTDLIIPNSLTSLKDRDSTMMAPSHLFNTVCELKSQTIGKLFIYGALGNIPVFIDNKKIDFLNLSYKMFSGNESYKEIKEIIEENVYPHIHHLMDEHGIFQKIKQVPNDALATVYREVNDYKRMWVFLDLLTLTFDHAVLKSIGVNLENSLLNTKVFAKYQKLGNNSTIDRPARLRDKLPILPNFYPEVDVRIIQIVLENENLISSNTKVDFGFYATYGFESITSIPLIVYGLSKPKKKELRFVTLTDLMRKYVLIEKKLPINEQGRKLLLLNYETSSNLLEPHRCQIGKEQFINIIQDQDSINYSLRSRSLCKLLLYDKNQNNFVLSDKNTIISPSSFWKPIFHSNKYYLTLKGEDSVPLTNILKVNNHNILPGWFDLSKGILPCWRHGKDQNDYPPETIIRHHRKTMFEFLLTRYLPIIEIHNKIKNDKFSFETAIAHYPVDIAISKLINLKEFIITLYTESKISNRQSSGHEYNREMIESIYQFLYDIKSLSSVATSEFDVDILLSKISETILYYDDLYRYSPHLELFVNYYEDGDEIQEPFKNKVIIDSHNVPHPNPLQVVHYFTTESKVYHRYSHNLFKIYTNQDMKEKKYGKTHLAGFLADNNFCQINDNGKTYYRINDRTYFPDSLIHNPLDSIQLILFHQRQSMKDAYEFYSKYDLGGGNIQSLVATGRNEEDQILIKELLMKSFDIINQHAKQMDHILSKGIRKEYDEKSSLYSLMDFSLKTVLNSANFNEDKDMWKFLHGKKFTRDILQSDFIEKFTFLLKKNKLLNGLLSNRMLGIIPVSSYLRPDTPKNMLKLFAIPYKFLTALARLKDWKYPEISFISLVSGAGSRQAVLVNPRLILLYEEILNDNHHRITKKLDSHLIDSLQKAIFIVKTHYTDYEQTSLKGNNKGEILRKEVYSKQIGDVFQIVSSLEHLVNFDYLYKSQLTIGEQIIDFGGEYHPILKNPISFKSFVAYCQNIGISRVKNNGIYNNKIISETKVTAPFSLENQHMTKNYLYNCRILAPAGVINKQGFFTSDIRETLIFEALLDSSAKLIQALEFAELVRNGEKTIKAHRKVYNDDNFSVSKYVSFDIIMSWRDLIS